MGLSDRISLLVRANMNDSLNPTQDPVKLIEQAIVETQKNLIELRQKVATVNVTQQKLQTQYDQAELLANTWYECAQLALEKGGETIAEEAMMRRKSHAEMAATLKSQLDQHADQLEKFNRILKDLEEKLSQLKSLQERISRTQINVNNSELNRAEDLEEILEKAIIERQEDLVQLHQRVAAAIATQKRTQQQYTQEESQVNLWEQRVQLALQKGKKNLAAQALIRQETHAETAAKLKSKLDQQAEQLEKFNKNLEEKLSQLKSLQERTLATQTNVNNFELNRAEDPEKILEKAIIEMQEDLVQLRQAVATATTKQKWIQQDYNQAKSQVNLWEQRVQLARQKGKKNLAAQALIRQETHAETAAMLKFQLDQKIGQVESLQRKLEALESKISEAKTKKNMLKAKAQAAKTNEQIQEILGGINTSDSAAAFEWIEAWLQVAGELAGSSLEQQFALLESGSDVDDELAAMKANLLTGSSGETKTLPAGETGSKPPSEVDDDLEQLRKQLNDI